MRPILDSETKVVNGGITMDVNGADYTIFIHNNEGGLYFSDTTLKFSPTFLLSTDHSTITSYFITTVNHTQDNYLTFGGLAISRENVSDGVILNISRT